MLMWDKNVITYASRELKFDEIIYLTYDLEFEVVVFAFKICRHYLNGVKYEIFRDYFNLQYMFTQKDLNPR